MTQALLDAFNPEILVMIIRRRDHLGNSGGRCLLGTSENILHHHPPLAVVVNTMMIDVDHHRLWLKETDTSNPLHLNIGVATRPLPIHPIVGTAGLLRDHRRLHSMIDMTGGLVNGTCLHILYMEGPGRHLVFGKTSTGFHPQGKSFLSISKCVKKKLIYYRDYDYRGRPPSPPRYISDYSPRAGGAELPPPARYRFVNILTKGVFSNNIIDVVPKALHARMIKPTQVVEDMAMATLAVFLPDPLCLALFVGPLVTTYLPAMVEIQ